MFSAMLKPNPHISVSDYVNGSLYIPPPAANPGPYRLSLTPYAKEIMDECSPMSATREIVVVSGTQMSKTQIALNVIAYYMDNAPTSMLVGFPNDRDGRHFVRTRIDTMFDNNPKLRDLIGSSRRNASGDTSDYKEFPGGFLKRAIGEAASSFMSTMCQIVILDEYDAFPRNIQGKGSGKDLAVQRTATYRGREKIFISSTPTNENSQILSLLEYTDQRHYFLESPGGETFELDFQNFKWRADGTDVKEVWYELDNGERIDEYMMPQLLKKGVWIPTNPNPTDPTKTGYWISGLYSPFRSWRDIVTTYLEALEKADKGDHEHMTSFYNNILALPYSEYTARPDTDKMMLWAKNKTTAYQRYSTAGSFPDDVLLLTSATDVQENRLETEIKGWMRNGSSRSIEHFVFPCEAGKTTSDLSANCWHELREVIKRKYMREDGLELGIGFNAIDRAHIPEIVIAFASSIDPRCEFVIPVYGLPRHSNTAISNTKVSKMTYPGGVVKQVMYKEVGVNRLKGEAYAAFRLPYDKGDSGICMFPEDYEQEYFEQLTSEEYIKKKSATKGQWKKIRNRNEALDLHVYNLAMWYFSGLHGWKESDYDLHEAKLKELAKGTPKKKAAERRYIGRATYRPNLGL